MNILIFVGESYPPRDLVDGLRQAGHLVSVATTAQTTLDAISRDPPDIAVVTYEGAGDHFNAILRSVTGSDDMYRALVCLTQKDTPERRTALYAAGVDDVAGPAVAPQELATRVKSVERIVRLERKLIERSSEHESALSRLEMQAIRRGQVIAASARRGEKTQDVPFLLARSWTTMEDVLSSMCTEYLQRPFKLVTGLGDPAAGAPGAHISLTDVEHQVRLDLTFFSPPEAARAIAIAFCGDPSIVDDSVVRDVLLELANSGMGAVKSAFLHDGFKFSGAAPKSSVFAGVAHLFGEVEAKRALAYQSDDLLIHVFVAVRHTNRAKVKPHALREGMVVATDVLSEGGALLLAAGTRVTATSAARIQRLAPKIEVELADFSAEG